MWRPWATAQFALPYIRPWSLERSKKSTSDRSSAAIALPTLQNLVKIGPLDVEIRQKSLKNKEETRGRTQARFAQPGWAKL